MNSLDQAAERLAAIGPDFHGTLVVSADQLRAVFADHARLTHERDALAVALAQLRGACLEDIGGKHEEVQCAICLRYWPIAGQPQHDATCILAAERQP
jgi:hypothetical protein